MLASLHWSISADRYDWQRFKDATQHHVSSHVSMIEKNNLTATHRVNMNDGQTDRQTDSIICVWSESFSIPFLSHASSSLVFSIYWVYSYRPFSFSHPFTPAMNSWRFWRKWIIILLHCFESVYCHPMKIFLWTERRREYGGGVTKRSKRIWKAWLGVLGEGGRCRL